MEREYDPYDPGTVQPPAETAAPAAGGDPWTPEELAASQQWANQYVSSHQIPTSYGNANDIANSYLQFRRAGMSHADAMAKLQTVPAELGWEKAPTHQDPTPTPDPTTTTTGGTPSPVTTGPPPTTIAPTVTPFPGVPSGQPGVPTPGFGAAPVPYMSNPDAPVYQPLPVYRAPEWTGGDYVAPTEAELYASPGYQARLDARLEAGARRYAAQGTILNGGTVKALDRSAQDYATGEYQTLNANKYDQYKTRYAQFADAAGRDLASRSINAADANTTFANRTKTYESGNARTLNDYLTNATAKRNNELDYWSRLQDVNQTGANLAGGSR